MKIPRAVITAANPKQRSLPLQHVVDQHGNDKTALQLVIEEAVEAGVGEICVVICPGDADSYRRAAGEHAGGLTFVEQDNPRGYGDALFRAARFIRDEPFLHLVGDHLYVTKADSGCAKQLVEVATTEACTLSAVQPTRESKLHLFGTIGGRRVANRDNLYEVKNVLEKPTPTQAEQELIVAGLRSSHYLCLFGIHVLTPSVVELLGKIIEDSDGSVQLSDALSQLAQREQYLAMAVQGFRYNIGEKYGLLMSQLALGLSGKDRDNILTELLGLVAQNMDYRPQENPE